MAKKPKKAQEAKSNAESVLDDILAPAEQAESAAEEAAQEEPQAEADSAQDETVAEVQAEEPVADAVESAGEPEPAQETAFIGKAWEDQEPAVSNLTVEMKPKVEAASGLEWKSAPCSPELENLLRHKAQHFAKLHYGIQVSLTGVTQELLNKCASDYRFAREIEKLTRPQ